MQLVQAGHNVFITGPAGTGKSFVVREIIAALPVETTFITASTGIAACNLGGISVHAFAGIGVANKPRHELIAQACNGASGRRWRTAKGVQ